jgi:hypothetical protein
MPKEGAFQISEFMGKLIATKCADCGTHRVYNADRLLGELGDMPMPGLLPILATREGCSRSGNKFYNRCAMRFDRGGGAAYGEAGEEDRPTGKMPACLGDLAEWQGLIAVCNSCKHKSTLDRWGLQRRFGKSVELEAIAPRLICKKCSCRGGQIEIGYVQR